MAFNRQATGSRSMPPVQKQENYGFIIAIIYAQ